MKVGFDRVQITVKPVLRDHIKQYTYMYISGFSDRWLLIAV